MLFKRFADVNSIDIELDTEDPDAFINGGQADGPDLRGHQPRGHQGAGMLHHRADAQGKMDIPVFHDDQHGTAVICAAGLINALHLSGKKIEDVRIVLNGAGAAGIACLELLKAMGARHENCIACDTKGVIYQGRDRGHEPVEIGPCGQTDLRTLEEAMAGADVFLGVSVKGAVTRTWSPAWPTTR